ncbi:hypothetical protein JOD31_001966 [Methylopila capsulata]|uniref:Uncharacterized protein n=1 Tax=Methylopila capsulata TaxID=61654 RepID=A0A9W6ITH2_9HYPH|nr:hypothetical protein [Methylopila capsulata]MBM7851741.1 hypothetical protein [Methylopila capsulata]GLK54801.1 hypothetical protein GCM10008170_08200 [Methylopila capsulata]
MTRFLVGFVLALLGAGSGPAWAQALREPISGFSIVKPDGWLIGTERRSLTLAEAQALMNRRQVGTAVIFTKRDPAYPVFAPRVVVRTIPGRGSPALLDDWRDNGVAMFMDMRNATVVRKASSAALGGRPAVTYRIHRLVARGGETLRIVEDYWTVPAGKGSLVVTTMRLANDVNDPRPAFKAVLGTASWGPRP